MAHECAECARALPTPGLTQSCADSRGGALTQGAPPPALRSGATVLTISPLIFLLFGHQSVSAHHDHVKDGHILPPRVSVSRAPRAKRACSVAARLTVGPDLPWGGSVRGVR